MSTPWYIDPNRLHLEIRDTERNNKAIYSFKEAAKKLLRAPEETRNILINRFVENGQQMIDEINSFNPTLVIDLACGAHPYKDAIKNIVGLDITPHQDVDYNYDFCATPFKDNVADVILLMNGFAYHKENQAVFDEIKRIAKPGAKVYCRTSNIVFVRQQLAGQAYINMLAKERGFTYFHPLQKATFSDPNDIGVYFTSIGKRTRKPNHRTRIRWVWTWQVNK